MQMLLPQMEKKRPRLTNDERKRIERMLDDGWTPYKIAKTLGRPPKTIMREMDSLIYTLTGNGQSVHAAVVNNPDVITVSEKTLYRYIDGGLLKPKLLGLEQTVRPWVTEETDPKKNSGKVK